MKRCGPVRSGIDSDFVSPEGVSTVFSFLCLARSQIPSRPSPGSLGPLKGLLRRGSGRVLSSRTGLPLFRYSRKDNIRVGAARAYPHP